jgi:hypothetical protein
VSLNFHSCEIIVSHSYVGHNGDRKVETFTMFTISIHMQFVSLNFALQFCNLHYVYNFHSDELQLQFPFAILLHSNSFVFSELLQSENSNLQNFINSHSIAQDNHHFRQFHYIGDAITIVRHCLSARDPIQLIQH